MKIRVVSDLHVDVNKCYDFGFLSNPENVDLNIICGDVGGDYQCEQELLDKINIPTVCVAGNHLGYNYDNFQSLNNMICHDNLWDCTKRDCIKRLTHKYNNPKQNYVTYLENNYITFDKYVIFGGCMYSDFCLYGKNHKSTCKHVASRWLNDFRYVFTYTTSNGPVRPITPTDYIRWNTIFKKQLSKCIKDNPDRDIIVVTHFAPSIKSIESKYLNRPNRLNSPGSELNAVYACDLEQFIQDNPQIKLWTHGHVHSCFNYNVGQCKVICSPYGYYGYEQQIKPQDYYGTIITI